MPLWLRAIADNLKAMPQTPDECLERVDYYRYTKPEMAWRYVEWAIQLNKSNGRSFHMRGHLYAEMGNDARAFADFATAIRLEPQEADHHNCLGILNLDCRNYRAAMANFGTAAAMTNDNGSYLAMMLLARLMDNIKGSRENLDQIMREVKQLLKRHPDCVAVVWHMYAVFDAPDMQELRDVADGLLNEMGSGLADAQDAIRWRRKHLPRF